MLSSFCSKSTQRTLEFAAYYKLVSRILHIHISVLDEHTNVQYHNMLTMFEGVYNIQNHNNDSNS